ncbi:MAG: endolytic transglycosylase MltG [Candidatus Eisenbacteria bacterium]
MRGARVKRTVRKGALVFALVLVAFLVSLLLSPQRRHAASTSTVVLIPKGAEVGQIGDILKEEGVIGNTTVFILTAKILRVERNLRAGRYTMVKNAGTFEAIRQLEEGMKAKDFVTIPEGLTSSEIADVLFRELLVDPKAFLTLINDSSFASAAGVSAPSLEGYLFPDSYAFVPGTEPAEIVKEMVSKGRHVFGIEFGNRGKEMGLTWHQALTLASIVEGEAQVDEERPRIAAVFWNRLRAGFRLQADPTVAFALGGRRERIVYKDLEVDSPYNTYRVSGLPPGPISNPGEQAVRAVLYPLEGCEDLYFVARGDGTHVFSSSLAEHLAAIESIRGATANSAKAPGGATAPGGKAMPNS